MAAPRLKERYKAEVVPELMREFSYGNVMQVPRVQKITVNIGLGEARENARAVESATADIATITGQKPVVTKAKKAIANFKIRENMPVGVAVTLRGDRMYEFLDRLLNSALPRIRDFHGVATKAFDGRGNFALGLREQLIFPEIEYDKVDRIRGMQVNIITSARTDEEGRRLLEMMGMPFAKDRT
jgi:large subunit ribosomal protein L5